MSDPEYMYPCDNFGGHWMNHVGIWLHGRTPGKLHILDPRDFKDGKYRVLATYDAE